MDKVVLSGKKHRATLKPLYIDSYERRDGPFGPRETVFFWKIEVLIENLENGGRYFFVLTTRKKREKPRSFLEEVFEPEWFHGLVADKEEYIDTLLASAVWWYQSARHQAERNAHFWGHNFQPDTLLYIGMEAIWMFPGDQRRKMIERGVFLDSNGQRALSFG